MRDDRLFLGVDEGVRRAVEHVVGEHAKGEGTTHLLVLPPEVRDAVPQVEEGARYMRVVHEEGEVVALRGLVGEGPEAAEKGVRPLVSQQEGDEFLLAAYDALRKAGGGLFAEQVMCDECGHECVVSVVTSWMTGLDYRNWPSISKPMRNTIVLFPIRPIPMAPTVGMGVGCSSRMPEPAKPVRKGGAPPSGDAPC